MNCSWSCFLLHRDFLKSKPYSIFHTPATLSSVNMDQASTIYAKKKTSGSFQPLIFLILDTLILRKQESTRFKNCRAIPCDSTVAR